MIKQQQRVIKKGDHYQIETYQQTMMLISKSKKQDQQQNSASNIPVNEYIVTEVPGWGKARESYFSAGVVREFQRKGLDELMEELVRMAKGEEMRDEDRKEVEVLMEEIGQFASSQQMELNELPVRSQESAKPIQSQHTSISLTANYNVAGLSQRISKLQSLDFPELIALEHQLQIMLGEKKPLQSLELSQLDQKQRQELTNLYNHLNSLSLMSNTNRVIDSVFLNESKHVEMENWVGKVEKVQAVNADLLAELKQDREIVNRLEASFEGNVKQVREILAEIKAQK